VSVLCVENLSVAYRAGGGWLRALEDVSFEVGEGRALGVVGESGSGKSTSALALLGLLAPEARIESGRALFKGQSLFDLPEPQRRALRGNRMSIVFQDPFTSLNPAIAVGRQIAEPLVWHKGMPEAAAAAEVVRLLVEVGIPTRGGGARLPAPAFRRHEAARAHRHRARVRARAAGAG
jgi:peptide/nickel transport system ATP-binding protein